MWTPADGRTKAKLETSLPKEPALYVFVVNGVVCYAGKTIRPLADRMRNYQYSDRSQSTNTHVAGEITRCLEKGESVKIYAFFDPCPPCPLRYGSFPVSLAAGLEDGVIAKLQPEWNRQKPR